MFSDPFNVIKLYYKYGQFCSIVHRIVSSRFYVIDVENHNNKNPCNVHCRGVEAVILLI